MGFRHQVEVNMLKTLRLKNFKSWEDTGKIEFAPITAFYGANSSGKSSIIQSLLLLKQTLESTDRELPLFYGDDNTPLAYVNLGGFEDVVHRGETRRNISFEFSWTSDTPIEIKDASQRKSLSELKTSDFSFSTEIHKLKSGKDSVAKLTYKVGDSAFSLIRTDKSEYKLETERPPFKLVRHTGRAWAFPKPDNFYGFPAQVRNYYQNANFLPDLELKLENFLDSLNYLGPLREYPRRQYHWPKTRPQGVGKRGELVVQALAYAMNEGMELNHGKGKRKKKFDAFIADWLKQLNLLSDFKLSAPTGDGGIYKLALKKERNSKEVSLPDVGFGVSQVLPLIVLLCYVTPGSVVLIEQPEIHLHPAVQTLLADLIIEAALYRKVQIIFESHSEHLLRRLQRRVAEEVISNNDLKVYFMTRPL